MQNTFTPVQKKLVISPGSFFDPNKNTEFWRTLNDFLFENIKVSLFFNSLDFGMYMVPKIDGHEGKFIDSKKTEGFMIKGLDFDELMYKLWIMIMGEEKIDITTNDFKTLYALSYNVNSKELRIFAKFTSEEVFIKENKCRSCGAKWPLG